MSTFVLVYPRNDPNGVYVNLAHVISVNPSQNDTVAVKLTDGQLLILDRENGNQILKAIQPS